jgi:autotransporter-associated beta strand protein
VISGSSVTKSGAGTLVLANASNSYTAGTIVNGGVVQVSADGALGAVPGTLTSNITLNGGTLQFGASFDIANTRGITMGAGGGTIDTQGFSNPTGYTPNKGFSGGDLTKIGTGTFFAAATTGGVNNVWTGNLIIKQGVWKIVATDGLPINPTTGGLRAAQVTLDGGTWQIGANVTATQSNRGITIAAGGGSIDTQGFTLTWPGPVAGTVSTSTLNKIGTGTLRLNSSVVASNYVGNVNVAAGTLQLDGGTAMGDLAAVSTANVAGATLNFTGNETIGSLAGGGTTGGNTTLGTFTLTTGGNGNSTNYAGIISGSGGKLTKAGTGTMTLSGANTYTGATTVSAGKLLLAQSLTQSTSLSVQNAATAEIAAGSGKVIKTGSLLVTGTGKVDLTDNKMIVAAGASQIGTLNAIRTLIVAGRNVPGGGVGDGTWTGNGITSSTAAAAFTANGVETRAVGYALNSFLPLGPYATFGGQSVSGTDILVRYTRNGDATLDGLCGDDDVTVLGAFYDSGATSGHQWYEGDFNFDGKIDDSDVTILGAFYNQGAPPLASDLSAKYGAQFASAFEAGQAMPVPEPAGVVLLAAGAVGLLGRRGRLRK